MKTAVSVPDRLFKAADRASKKLGVSRSELYSTALEDYLRRHPAMSVRERLDEVYGHEPSALDPALEELQRRALRKKER
ncbi:MAG TPA: ChpI protein [Thermoanaerobaculia bacterium]|nr:ChpI protein [Thermoanaerobaculia bacterium]